MNNSTLFCFLLAVVLPYLCICSVAENEEQFFVRPARLGDLVAGPLRVSQFVATDRFNKPEDWQYLTQYSGQQPKDKWQGFLPYYTAKKY